MGQLHHHENENHVADVVALVRGLSTAPVAKEDFDAWIRQEDVTPFLRANASHHEFITHLSGNFAFMHTIAVPRENVEKPDIDDLLSWNLNIGSSWSIDIIYSGGEKSIRVEEPLSGASGKALKSGENLVFPRSFEGRQGQKSYYEIPQKFAHIFDLHFLEERKAYCRLDKRGDIEDVVRIIEIPERGDRWGTSIVTFNREALDEYLAVTDSALLVLFDFTRYRPSYFLDWHELGNHETFSEDRLFYRSHIEPGYASYMRGVQIIHSELSKDEVIGRLDHSVEKHREYASFLAWDWKNGVLREVSTAPDAIANYFTKSDLPFEVSPAFFRAEVLLKYKTDSEKYRLEDRSITCRNAWHLETYDINEVGQVHTYLIYLQRLPYEEQLYWKSYNEAPKAPISQRALTTDFKGEPYKEYDALASLKNIVLEVDHARVPWWTLRAEGLPSRVHYPVTSSPDEWSNEILNLDQMLVEGFETKWLKQKSIELKQTPDPKFQSLKLIEECLMGLGLEETDARKITASLHQLHWLRSKLKGHASGENATSIRKSVLTEHGGYGKHFRVLCGECDESFRSIAEHFKVFVAVTAKTHTPKAAAASAKKGKGRPGKPGRPF